MADTTTKSAPAKKAAAPKPQPPKAPVPQFTKDDLVGLHRDVLNKDEWTDAELDLLVEAAVESNTREQTAASDAVWQQSSAAYILMIRGKFEDKGAVKAYADKIGKSETRIKDYILYGRAVVRHGLDPNGEDFRLLKAGASGGHRADINKYVDRSPEDFSMDGFHNLVTEAVQVEKEKADKRKAERAAEKEARPAAGTRAEALAVLDASITKVEEYIGVYNEADLEKLTGLTARLAAVPGADAEKKAKEAQAKTAA